MATKEKDEAVLILLGKRIVFLRKKKGYSQLTLSFLADVSKTYLSDVERGSRNPSVSTLSRIAKALEVNLEELFEGVGEYRFLSESKLVRGANTISQNRK